MTAALISFGSTILAILLVSAIRTEGRLSRLEGKIDIITAHLLPARQPVAAPQTDTDAATASASESASESSQQTHSALAASGN